MTQILRDALRASLEDVVEEINPLSDHIETEIDEVLMEVEEASGELTQSEAVVEELETAETSLEAIRASLEAHIAEGGMSPQTALSHKVAVANALRRLPIDPDQYTLSTESFGGTGDKLSATQVALESVKDVLARIWEGIQKAIRKMIEAAKTFVQTIGKSAPALKAGANALKARARSVGSNSVKGDDELNAASIAKVFHSGGKFDAGSVASGLGDIVKGGNAVMAASVKAAAVLVSVGNSISAGSFDPAAATTEIATAAHSGLPDALPGGYVITKGSATSPTVTMAQANKYQGDGKISVPQLSQVTAIADGVIAVANFLESYSKKTFTQMEKSTADALNKIKKDTIAAEKDPAKAKALKDNMGQVTKMTSVVRGIGPQYCGYAARSAKAALSFGNGIVKKYGAAAANLPAVVA